MSKSRYTKASDWQPIIQEWQASGLNKKLFCQQRNINYKRFYRWYHQLQQGQSVHIPKEKQLTSSLANFIPVRVSEAHQKALKSEQHCTLLLNNQWRLQIPVDVMNANFLQMLMLASGAR